MSRHTKDRCFDPEFIIPVARKTTLDFKTGAWSASRPRHVEKASPCQSACPVGNDLARALPLMAKGQADAALAVFLEETPLPAVCGRVCYQPCAEECNRGRWDGPVSIRALERSAAELGRAEPTILSKAGRDQPVAVVGSGPSGLTAAYHLARLGHPVTILEKHDRPGGLLRTALPAFRLDETSLEVDMARLTSLGVELITGVELTQGDMAGLSDKYAAVYLAVGASEPVGLDLPGANADGVLGGLEFLTEAKADRAGRLSGWAIVIGGGNVAMDAARTALRLGAAGVDLVCLECRDDMPAHHEEVARAEAEGIAIHAGWGPEEIATANGRAAGVSFFHCISVLNGQGRFVPQFDQSKSLHLAAETVILAVGQRSGLPVLLGSTGPDDPIGRVRPDGRLIGLGNVFAGGDAVSGPSSVSLALAAGKRAAADIHLFLNPRAAVIADTRLGQGRAFSLTAMFAGRKDWDPRIVVRFEDIDPVFLDHRPPQQVELLPLQRSLDGFKEVQPGLSRTQARLEAERCFGCGTCQSCDRCLDYCPDGSVFQPDGEGPDGVQYAVNADYCKGCGVCAAVCIRGVVTLEAKS